MQISGQGNPPLSSSYIGLGGLQFGGHFGGISRHEIIRTIQAALEGGITLFDTSPSYGGGMAESLLGEILDGEEKSPVVMTKIGSGIDSTGHFWCLNNRPNILRQVEGSLKRLRRECIDVYLIPGEDPSTPIAETVGAMEELRARGKIRFIGYCTPSIERLREALRHGSIDVVQSPYNIFNRTIEPELVPFCVEKGIPVLACEPFCRGLLLGTMHKNSSFDADDLRVEDRRFRGERYRLNIENVSRLQIIADQEGVSMVQLSLGWIQRTPGIAGIICGAKNRLQIRQSILASSARLMPDAVNAVNQVVDENVRQQFAD